MKKIRTLSILSAFVFMLAFSPNGKAQSVTDVELKDMLVKDWQRAKAYTADYLTTMPSNQYAFKATDSVRSFAQQMLHLAQANYFLMSTALGLQSPGFVQSDLERSAGAQGKDSLLYYVNASYDFCINAVQNSDVKKWGEKLTVFGMNMTRLALVMKTFEHQTHHRGQTTIYIRQRGIKPPNERLF